MSGAPPGCHPPQGARPGPARRATSGHPWRHSPAAGERAPRLGSARRGHWSAERGTDSAVRAESARLGPQPRRDTHMNREETPAAARPGKKDPLRGLLQQVPDICKQAPGKASLRPASTGLRRSGRARTRTGKRC